MEKLPYHVIHYHRNDPRVTVGGVETFALVLQRIFARVEYMTPRTRDVAYVRGNHIPVICDNQFALDWPDDVPVIAFEHGVAAVKFAATRKINHLIMMRGQKRAARRPNTLWAANSEWVAEASNRLYGSATTHVIYYPVDTAQFDGALDNRGSRLILHDARLKHKGKHLIEPLRAAFPDWDFQHLACPHDHVADRMRRARAFIHLSRYEGNSLVCNEAMAMDLPCLFTRVGLMQDRRRPEDVYLVEAGEVFRDRRRLVEEMGTFLGTLGAREYHPRAWVMANATIEIAAERWQAVMDEFQAMSGWEIARAGTGGPGEVAD